MSDLSELFARDPMSLSTQDIDTIIARYRQARAQFQAGDKTAGSAKKVKAATPTVSSIDLDALGLLDKKP